MENDIRDQMINLNEIKVLELCRNALDRGVHPIELVQKLREAMDVVGKKYEEGEYFLADLIMCSEIMKSAIDIVKPHLKRETDLSKESFGRVIVGTVEGDLHDIGKNLFATLLQLAGFEVHDLGTDVTVADFAKAVEELRPNIVAMSALLTTTMERMADVIAAIEKKGLRGNVRVIVGGAPISRDFAKSIGADAAAMDAVEGLSICKDWASSGS